jgi:enhancing lycopene biosynthesis protein 2
MILSGCGHLDGTDVEEATQLLFFLDRADVRVQLYAPEGRADEFDGQSGQPTGQQRSMIVEASRLSRLPVTALKHAVGPEMDGWFIPGGSGALRQLSDFASKGQHASVHKDVGRVMRDAFAAQVPIGASSHGALVLAAAAKSASRKLRLTVGDESETARSLAAMGHHHVVAAAHEVVIDQERRVVSCPARLSVGARPSTVAAGMDALVTALLAFDAS